MNEALFRLGEIEGMYFSRSMQGWKKESPIFSFFTEDECLNQSFIDLLINSITLNITIIKKNEDVVGGLNCSLSSKQDK